KIRQKKLQNAKNDKIKLSQKFVNRSVKKRQRILQKKTPRKLR
ncbi:2976_t:CDS:1, partial [Racocetra persica]